MLIEKTMAMSLVLASSDGKVMYDILENWPKDMSRTLAVNAKVIVEQTASGSRSR